MIDLLIRDGFVVDGSGAPAFRGDIAIDGGKIVDVGKQNGASARRTIDASGRVVCPGFVDPHSHSDFTLLTNPAAESTIRQGVTTEVVGNCGWTYAPVSSHSHAIIEGRLRTFAYGGPVEWSSFGEHLSFLANRGHAPNLAWFVGHNTVRCAAGVTGEQATEDELVAMENYVAEAMHAGALGLSTGLEFKPGREAPTDE
ncbi:MAG TPA: amidohydrolase family protein, partial [Gaiellaceae bacterium]